MIDGVLGVFVVGQLVWCTLKGGHRFLQTRTTCRMEGPPILPESSLWDITHAFREAVALDLLRENYTHYPVRVAENSVWNRNKGDEGVNEGYSLSLKPDPSVLGSCTDSDDSLTYNESTTVENLEEIVDTTIASHANDFLEMLSEPESPPAGAVTIRIDYNIVKNKTNETTRTETTELEHPSNRIMYDYLTELPGSNQTIHIRVHAAKEFSQLRTMFGISDSAFRKSLVEAAAPFVSFQSNSKGAARVGGIFFYSPDGGYLIKSIKKDEVTTFLEMLPAYSEFMKQNGRTTLLTRFCGMYDICIEGKIHTLVIMNAVFPSHSSKFLTERFDLKGSSVGRRVLEDERIAKGKDVVLKDLDFVESESKAISLKPGTKDALLSQLERDVSLLQNCSVIDYSLLLGVEPLTRQGKKQSLFGKRLASAFWTAVHGPVGVDGGKYATIEGARQGEPVICYVGLIDFLQPFNKKKYVEWKLKSLIHEKEEFSCIPPDDYARRLIAFLDEHIC